MRQANESVGTGSARLKSLYLSDNLIGDQGVMAHLSFKEDGTIEGWGEDAEDGRYAIEDGVWSTPGGDGDAMPLQTGGRVAWVEKYDRGFQVALRGQVLADGTIRAMWASTFGVAGSVDLEMRR